MDRKKKTLLLIVLACALLTAAICAVVYWYRSPGAHLFANRLRVELDTECYIVNPVTGKIIKESHITFHTTTNLSSQETTGSALVENYPISGKLIAGCEEEFFGNATLVHYSGVKTASDVNGSTTSSFSDITYLVYFDSAPEDTVVLISSYTPETNPLCAIIANTPEEAIEKCRFFWSNLANKQ